ncbi:GNAT family N-acetyltransferase [Tumebacillus algifaecis]|uniref:GNAT family N-acetyltransferase n=1 Tax=Tumebacillus algifaecis TaxID=1214604 RepID=A0A223D7A2_9BACL|nr:GNAT family N-acetyltransferase [Tumebacillus algifaecis]ASS77244.1 GNAT family N-acetyltransferase [Tumebacillus algifaecis]
MLIIRPSTAEDAVQLVALENIVWTSDIAPVPIHWDSTADYLQSCPPGSQLVADLDGVICGYVQSKPPTPLPSNSHVTELAIAVHPAYHSRGIGSQLLQAIEADARLHGKRKLTLRVLASNEKAIQFYKRCGYLEQGRLVQEFYLNGNYIDDLLMYKLL